MRKLVAVLLFIPMAAFAREPRPWLDAVPPTVLKSLKWSPVSAFFEVPASTLATAQYWLAKSAYVALKKPDLGIFGRPDFVCQGMTVPYLVRAQYITSGGSYFSLFWAPHDVLIVQNASLTTHGALQQSAVIACLSQPPSTIYSYISPGVQ